MKNKHLKLSLVGPLVLAAFLGSGRAFADEMASSTSQDSLATTVSSSSTTEATKTTSTETGTEVSSTSSDNSSSAVVTDASSTEKASTSTREATDSGIVVPSDDITSSTTVTDTREVSSTDTTAEAERVTTTVSGNQLAIQYNDKIASDESVKFAVWSEVNGQDDLVWYDASATGAAYIDLSKHKSYGTYNVHTYSFKDSQGPVGLSALTVTVPEPAVKTSIRKKDEESYEVTVTDVPETINQIAVPVWSEVNGQDDIVWYQATKLSSTSYQAIIPLSDHHYDLGHYAAHVYGQSSITGGLLGLAVTSGFDYVDSRPNATVSVVNYAENKTRFDVVLSGNASTKPVKAVSIAVWSEDKGQDDLKWYTPTVTNNQARVTVDIANHSNTSDSYNVHVYTDYEDGSRVGQVLGAYKITKPVVKNDVSTQLTDAGIAITLDSSQVSDYTQVRFAVWSEDKGQDDLVWYAADSKGQAIAPYTDHSGFGTYHVHTYLASNGQMIGLNASSLTIARPDVKVGIEKETDTTYVVTVGQVPAYLESVVIPVWSDTKGQDDLTWVAAQKQSNGEYKATVSLKDHQYDAGHYSLHVYGKSQLGEEMIGLAVTDGFTVQTSQTTHVQVPKIEVTAYDKANGKVTLSISEQADSKKIQTVRVAAWSEENQANLHWYSTNIITDGKAVVTVDEQYHKGLQGNYTIHTYIDFTDGTTKGFVVGNYELTAPKKNIGSASQGNYDIVNRIIYLDAGHGGKDPGATYFGQSEKTLNLQMQELVKARLEAAGYQVITTRDNDTFVDLLDRSQKVNASSSDLFLSMHFNAGSAQSNGIETYYYQYDSNYPSRINQTYHNNAERLNRSALLANAIQEGTVAATHAKNNGVQRNTFAVLRETTAPAVLVELGYMSNKEEFDKINTRSYQEKLANGIVAGIQKYYQSI